LSDTGSTVDGVTVTAARPVSSGEVLMTLGPIRFSVQETSFQELRRKLSIRTGKGDRADGPTARQALGTDETVEIEGAVFAAWRGGLGRVQSFYDLARDRQPQMLTDGMGNVWGKWLIEEVEETASRHLANGAPLKQAFKIMLGFYGQDASITS
jgi:phage protein U